MDFVRVLNHLNKVNQTKVLTLAEANAFAQEGFHIYNRFKHQDIAEGKITFDDTIKFLSDYSSFPFEKETIGSHLHFKDLKERLVQEQLKQKVMYYQGDFKVDELYINAESTGIKTNYDINGNELVVKLGDEELILTEEKVKGYIEREKEIMRRIATGNYLDRF